MRKQGGGAVVRRAEGPSGGTPSAPARPPAGPSNDLAPLAAGSRGGFPGGGDVASGSLGIDPHRPLLESLESPRTSHPAVAAHVLGPGFRTDSNSTSNVSRTRAARSTAMERDSLRSSRGTWDSWTPKIAHVPSQRRDRKQTRVRDEEPLQEGFVERHPELRHGDAMLPGPLADRSPTMTTCARTPVATSVASTAPGVASVNQACQPSGSTPHLLRRADGRGAYEARRGASTRRRRAPRPRQRPRAGAYAPRCRQARQPTRASVSAVRGRTNASITRLKAGSASCCCAARAT